MNMQLKPEQLAEKKAEIATRQAADMKASIDVQAALEQLAYEIHNEAHNNGKTPSYADSLTEAATRLITAGAKRSDFPAAAIKRLHLYAPAAGAESGKVVSTDPIANAAGAVEAAKHSAT